MWSALYMIGLLLFPEGGASKEPNTFEDSDKTLLDECWSSYQCYGKLLCFEGQCQCFAEHYWNGSDCLMKKQLNTVCNATAECYSGLVCDGTCNCHENEYIFKNKCLSKKGANERCSSTEECQMSLHCARNVCQCYSTDYWNGSRCILRKDIHGTCTTQIECRDTLDCRDNRCTCDKNAYWNGTFCMKKKTIDMTCGSDTECQEIFQCRANKCHCHPGEYWNGNECAKKKTFAKECATDDECEEPLHCTKLLCNCEESKYWAGSTCDPRKTVDQQCKSSMECREDLVCSNSKCICNSLSYWDGIKCQSKGPSECSEILSDEDGIYEIYPGHRGRRRSVYCVMRGDEKWTVIQRRFNGSVDFRRSWKQFKNGFGSVKGEYWLGNDNLHWITSNGYHELSIYLEDWRSRSVYANYSSVSVGDENSQYVLSVSGYSGDAGNSFEFEYSSRGYYHSRRQNNKNLFGTFDGGSTSCSTKYGGVGWWFNENSCSYYAALNGKYNEASIKGFNWYKWTSGWNRPLRKSMMMIRKKT